MSKTYRLVIYTIVFCVSLISNVGNLYAQDFEVKGVVRDEEGQPLTGVSIVEVGTSNGVYSGYSGDYSIRVNKGSTLRFSFLGFKEVEIKVTKNKYDVVLKEEHSKIDQVVVTGYSQVSMRKSTGAVAMVSSKDLSDNSLKNVDQLLQGKLAGVVVSQTSGRPGASASIRIRGTNTLTGNAEPLWVIDGVPMQKNIPNIKSSQIRNGDFDNIFANGLAGINPNDIESISVLKDAAAAAIYGSQAANGVIVVTTKRGSSERTQITYNGTLSIKTKPFRNSNLMNSKEKIEWEKELWNEFSVPYLSTSHYPVIGIVGQIYSGYGRFSSMTSEQKEAEINRLKSHSTDWFNVLFRNSLSQTHFVSMSGGKGLTTYYISGGFSNDNGIVIKTGSNSYTFNGKLDFNIVPWMKFDINTDFSYVTAYSPSNNVDLFRYAYFANPYERPYNEDGSYSPDETYYSMQLTNTKTSSFVMPKNGFNIMREINETSSKSNSASFTLTGRTTIDILKGFNFTGLASFSYMSDMSENINGKDSYAAWQDRPFEISTSSQRRYGSITQFNTVNTSYILRGQFNYTHTFFSNHLINAIAGAEIRSSFAQSMTNKNYGYDPITDNHSTPVYEVNENGKIDYTKLVSYKDIMDALSGRGKVENAFASFYGSATYNYLSRYIASVTLRSDGSNNFGSKQQFNLNWSISGAWNLDQEPWMRHISHIISTLSIRSGFGYTGGVNKTVYPVLIMDYLPFYRQSNNEFYRTGRIANAPNPNLRWEKNRTFNVGLNFGFIDDRITGEFAYYRNKNLDLVTNVGVESTTGFESQGFNTSEQENNGFELMLSSIVLKTKNFRWRVSGNISYNDNRLTKYVSPNGNLLDAQAVGYPLGHIFTGKLDGIDSETGMYDFQLRPDAVVSSPEDLQKYQNYLFYVGLSRAPWNGGISTSLSYKRLTISMSGNFSLGSKVIDNIVPPQDFNTIGGSTTNRPQTQYNDLYVNYLNVDKSVVNRWTEDNPRTDAYPRLVDAYGKQILYNGSPLVNSLMVTNYITKSVRLENVSYFRLTSLSVNWNMPDKWVNKLNLSGIGLGFNIGNLFTLTNYKGLDPESPGAVYPQARTFTFNLSINF